MHRPGPRPRLRRRTATALTALAAAALAIPALSACSAVQKAMDCAKTATAVVDGVDKLQKAAGHALDDPQETNKALDDLDTKLQQLSKSAHDPELSKAVDAMNQGIKDARRDIDANKAPNLKPLADATSRITAQCTPGDKE
ncbi:hypothetical protein ADL22_26290 [Streptomyces sp. NRRL F-4489]|uniref:hypothetical protein n=1 Tax=Streptomyces sp. NRRL F-4489 TaxID=1609095 RepID=UPI00074B2F16|nr:hypothetical protein [Streptomyces sp. NRRL F-4489]KUL35713.1 hypothetical protein ADL22_26290 [Streptomyces sp. NRRL F-4489]